MPWRDLGSNDLIGATVLLAYSDYKQASERVRERGHRLDGRIVPLLFEVQQVAFRRAICGRQGNSSESFDGSVQIR